MLCYPRAKRVWRRLELHASWLLVVAFGFDHDVFLVMRALPCSPNAEQQDADDDQTDDASDDDPHDNSHIAMMLGGSAGYG